MTRAAAPATAGLRRSIRVPGLVVHYVTSVIGTGILILPGHAEAAAGPVSLLAWVLLIVYSYPLGLIFARLSICHPSSRGIAEFVEYAFGARAARWLSAFQMLALLVANPVLGLAAARYLLDIWGAGQDNLRVIGVGFLFVIGSVGFNLLGVKFGSRVQGVLLGVLVGFLVLVVLIALPRADPANLHPVAPHGWGAVGKALIICFFGFIGWENAAPVAEEVVDPARTYPKAILRAVLAVGALYLAMSVTVVLVLPSATVAPDGQITAFATLLRVASGQQVAVVGNVVAIVLLTLASNAWVMGTSRVVHGAARDGLLPAALARTSARTGVPYRALLALVPCYGVPIGLLALTGADETTLITATSAAFLLIFLATFLAARRLLDGRGIRACVTAVAIGTAVILPFFGVSLLYAGVLLLAALVLAARQRAGTPGPAGPAVPGG